MKWTTKTITLLIVGGVLAPQSTMAGSNDIKVRCGGDTANTPQQVAGRNAWAAKCGYLEESDSQYQTAKGRYVTLSDYDAPWDANAPCSDGHAMLGWCVLAGCYTPEQRLMFNGEYIPIAEAALTRDVESIGAIGPNWAVGDFVPWVEEPIEYFIAGDEKKPVLRITVENGFSLEVTDNHPLVDSDGDIVEAATVRPGETRLLTSHGPSLVTAVTARDYDGKVWNVQPVSTRTGANLHLAEGFVSGSIRYQNEWADDESRIHLRTHLDTTPF
jgi:hypothetical protein